MGDFVEEGGGGEGGEGADVDGGREVGSEDFDGGGMGEGEDAGLTDEGEVGEAEGLVPAGRPCGGEERLGGDVSEVVERKRGGGCGGDALFKGFGQFQNVGV